jgi:hypothetical protein
MINKTVTTKLVGGLGNFMFQIAALYGYALKNGYTPAVTLQGTFPVHNTFDTYREDIFQKIIPTDLPLSKFQRYEEPSFNYQEIPLYEGDVLLDGYFQSEKYFEHCKQSIRELFTSSRKAEALQLFKHYQGMTLCSLHVRRGDYLQKQQYHPIQPLEYYYQAMSNMPSGTKYLVFSDDIEWCKTAFKGEEFFFVEGNKDSDDLLLMSCCTHNIIVNSTFSWWGAWLNENPDKKVIAPKKWFGSAYSHYNTEDIYCPDWIVI